MTAPPPAPFAPGEIIAGKYRVERVLGQGGMGIVVAAQHIHLEERVAIKLMLAEAAFSSEAVARFVREARAAAKLQSAHVAKVSDVGTLDDGRPYMVMEYLEGQDLSQVLSAGPLAVQDAADYLLQAAEAIAEAHSIGIVHRDLKPANLFLTRRRDRTPHVKVLDFGISKVSGASQSQNDGAMTKTSALMGSPLYMSPEQMTSVRDVDARSDIWALGIILFELLTGSPPFVGETLPQVCGLVIQSEAPPASSRRPDLPPEIDAIIQRCLAKAPAARFQTVAELATALQAFAGRHGRASVERILMLTGGAEPAPSARGASPPHVAPAATGQVLGTHANWGETKPPVPSKRSAGWLALPLVAVPLLGAAAWWALGSHQTEVAMPEASASVVSAAEPPVDAPKPIELAAPPAPAPSVAPVPAVSASDPVAVPPAPVPAKPAAMNKPPAPPTKSTSTKGNATATAAATPAPVAPVTAKPAVPASAKPPSMGGRL